MGNCCSGGGGGSGVEKLAGGSSSTEPELTSIRSSRVDNSGRSTYDSVATADTTVMTAIPRINGAAVAKVPPVAAVTSGDKWSRGAGPHHDLEPPVDSAPSYSATGSLLVPVPAVVVSGGGVRNSPAAPATVIRSTPRVSVTDGRVSLKIPVNQQAQDLYRKSELKAMKLRPQDLKYPIELLTVRQSVSEALQMEAPRDGYHAELAKAREEFERRFNQKQPQQQQQPAVEMKQFQVKKILGSGSFGVVALVRHVSTRQVMALKAMYKENVVRQKQVDHVLSEKRVLAACRWPFFMRMHYSFKDPVNLYLALEFVNGGEMFNVLRRNVKFSETQCKFYAAQVVMAFEYLHSVNILYRDLKPENILFDRFGYIKICDFGFAKRVRTRTYTLCGTPEYLAPEIIQSKGYAKAVDWWSFGILVYEMSAGFPPFNPDSSIADPGKRFVKLYESIVSDKVRFPGQFCAELKDLLRHLLVRDNTKRYGNLRAGVDDIKRHPWFSGVEWMAVYERRAAPPGYRPPVSSAEDASMFPNAASKQDEMVFKRALSSHDMLDRYAKEFVDF